jgi:signal transduction histidine kinase
MSHELRTPLNGIIGLAQLMHDEKLGPVVAEHKEYLGDILTSSLHLLRLINDVLDLAKVESGTIEFRPESVDLAQVLNGVRDVVRGLATEKQIAITATVDPSLDRIFVDPGRLKQILYNYLSNALKFTATGGAIRVRATPEGDDHFRIEVEDSGIGIRAEDLDRLFVEFHQLDEGAAKHYGGTGLGLALTRRLVGAQGGHVGVESTVGVGSRFFAVLPRIARPMRAEP